MPAGFHQYLRGDSVVSFDLPAINLIPKELFANAIKFPEICPEVVHLCFGLVVKASYHFIRIEETFLCRSNGIIFL